MWFQMHDVWVRYTSWVRTQTENLYFSGELWSGRSIVHSLKPCAIGCRESLGSKKIIHHCFTKYLGCKHSILLVVTFNSRSFSNCLICGILGSAYLDFLGGSLQMDLLMSVQLQHQTIVVQVDNQAIAYAFICYLTAIETKSIYQFALFTVTWKATSCFHSIFTIFT